MTTITDIAHAVIAEYDRDVAAGTMPAGLVDFTDLNNHCDANMYAEQEWTAYERETGQEMAEYVPKYQAMVEDLLAQRLSDQEQSAGRSHIAARRYVAAAEEPGHDQRRSELDRADAYGSAAGADRRGLEAIRSTLEECLRYSANPIGYKVCGGERLVLLPSALADVLETELDYTLRYPLVRATAH